MMRRIFAVARVEVLRLLRSPMTFTLLLLVPALQVVLFGYAIRPTASAVRVAVAASSPAAAKPVVDVLTGRSGVRLVGGPLGPGKAEAMVRAGTASIGIEVPAPNPAATAFDPPQPLQIIVDGSDAALTVAAVPGIEAAYWRAVAGRAGAQAYAPDLRIQRLYNPDLRADWTFAPSLAGISVMIAMIMLGSLSQAREREGGTWETQLSLPITASEALVGKLLPCMVIGALQGASVLALGYLLFDVPARGAVWALIALLPLFAAAHLALGYVISARAATQLSALQGAVVVYLPAMLLSGFLYPFETLPPWAQAIGAMFPLTHFIRAAHGALLRGDDAATVLAHGAPMAAFLVAAMAAALLAQPRRLD